MRFSLLLCLLCLGLTQPAFTQDASRLIAESQRAQDSLNREFANPETSPLLPEDLARFEGLEFYPIQATYIVAATFVRTPNETPFTMTTSTDRRPEYVKYAELHFTLKGQSLSLNVYKKTTPYSKPGLEDYLFIPFTDLTSGDGTYGGGRYLDARIPEGDTLLLDFNKAYNPYCAYSPHYSCPVPPADNFLPVRIEAGVKAFAH